MDALWWVPIGVVVWSGVSLAAGLWLGPVLRYCSRVREAVDAHTRETLARAQSPPQNERRTLSAASTGTRASGPVLRGGRMTQPPDTSRSTGCLESAAHPVHQEPYGQVMVSAELAGGLVVHEIPSCPQFSFRLLIATTALGHGSMT